MNFSAGSGSSNSQESGTTKPVIPEDWQKQFDAILGSTGAAGGKTPEQQFGTNVYRDILANGGQNAKLQGVVDNFWSPMMQKGATTLGGLNDSGNPNYTTPSVNIQDASGAQVAGTSGINANAASGAMAPYQQGYQEAVIDPALADLFNTSAIQQNDLRARYGGTPGSGREQVYAGQLAGDTARAAGTLSAQQRAQGFTTALGAGQFDVGNALDASKANQGVSLATNLNQAQMDQQTAMANADRNMQAQMFMANLLSGRQQFDINSENTNNANRAAAATGATQNLQTQGNNTDSQVQNYMNAGGTGLQQLLALLGLGTQTFGKDFQSSKSGSQSGVSGGIG